MEEQDDKTENSFGNDGIRDQLRIQLILDFIKKRQLYCWSQVVKEKRRKSKKDMTPDTRTYNETKTEVKKTSGKQKRLNGSRPLF